MRPRVLARALTVLAVGVTAAACGQVAGGSTQGDRVFAAACASCHGARGTPPVQMSQQLGVRDLAGAEFIARRTRDRILDQVRRGGSSGRMPAFTGALSDAQIEAVADFVMGLRPAR